MLVNVPDILAVIALVLAIADIVVNHKRPPLYDLAIVVLCIAVIIG